MRKAQSLVNIQQSQQSSSSSCTGDARRWYSIVEGGSRDKSILIGAKVEIMTKLAHTHTQDASQPTPSLSSFSSLLILLLLFPFDVIQPARAEKKKEYQRKKRKDKKKRTNIRKSLHSTRWRPHIYIYNTHKYAVFFFFFFFLLFLLFFIFFPLLFPGYILLPAGIYICSPVIVSWAPSFHYSQLLPSQHHEQQSTKKSRQDRQKRKKKQKKKQKRKKTCPIE